MPTTNTLKIEKGAEGYAEFHRKLEKMILENWGVDPKYSEPFSWGYSSTGFYIKDINGKEYVAIFADNTPAKRNALEKNLYIQENLNLSVETPKYIPTKSGERLLEIDHMEIEAGKDVENKVIVFYPFLSGIPPFDMDFKILEQAAKILYEIHQTDPDKFRDTLDEIETSEPKFLHGDLTPSNMLISYGEVVAVMDFEMSLIGPAEYDLARLAVFSWFRMKRTRFSKVLKKTQEFYPEKTDMSLIKKFARIHCEMHLNNIKQHQKSYESEKEYEKDLKFAQKKLRKLAS